ncbi:hypothetical protein [Streptomyces hydrogenans]|uniref:Uncharacterized protein n=1 Tax=Streptomyces hydrogenans TaxID=1873719 RepID=A0ABQ3PJD8_9ACTN|nr:hypothetical protein [Streptomyces hydrogenans]GHF94458.1 hypothetical protein GCM10018784_02660 [Streptomyces hydrogenans]GHI25140.1 hypothetical protein Shyd_65110 [Streptomyces hydrogenans]
MTYPPQQQFSQPSSGGSGGDTFNAADHRGALLLVYPKQYQPEVSTKNGPSSAADVDVIVVDRPGPDGKPLSFIGARLFGNLANSVRNDIGGQVLGRLDQISTQGGRTPWVLNQFTDQDAAMAGPVHQQYVQGLFKPAANPMQSTSPAPGVGAAPAQWQGQPSAPATPPGAPPQQQWQPQGAPLPVQMQPPPPAPAPAAPAAPAPPAPGGAQVDPQLAQFLAAHGVNAAAVPDNGTAVMIGKAFPDFAQAFPQYQ